MAVHAPIIAGADCAPGNASVFAALPTRRGMLALLAAAPIATLPVVASAAPVSTIDWNRTYRAFLVADENSDVAYERWDELLCLAQDIVKRDIYPTRPSCMRGPGCATLNDPIDELRASWMQWHFYPGLTPDAKVAKVEKALAEIEAYRSRVDAVMHHANQAKSQSVAASVQYEDAVQNLIDTPAPHLSALAVKLELAIERNNEPLMEACLSDLKTLADAQRRGGAA